MEWEAYLRERTPKEKFELALEKFWKELWGGDEDREFWQALENLRAEEMPELENLQGDSEA